MSKLINNRYSSFIISLLNKVNNKNKEESISSVDDFIEMDGKVYDGDLTRTTISLYELDRYIKLLLGYSNVNVVLPPFNSKDSLLLSTLKDFDKSGNDALGNLIELKIRLLKNVLNVFDPSYNYNEVIESLIDGSYPVKLISGFDKHLTVLLGSETGLGDTVFKVDNNARLHVRAIVNRAISDMVTLRDDMGAFLNFYYSEKQPYPSNKYSQVQVLIEHFVSIISIYIGVYINSNHLILNKKFKRLIPYFQENTNRLINNNLWSLDKIYNNFKCSCVDTDKLPFKVSHFSTTLAIISAFMILRYYFDRTWGDDLLITSDLNDLFTPPTISEETNS